MWSILTVILTDSKIRLGQKSTRTLTDPILVPILERFSVDSNGLILPRSGWVPVVNGQNRDSGGSQNRDSVFRLRRRNCDSG
jgi:hypothetical protein